MKKIFALLISLALILSLSSGTIAFAAGATAPSKETWKIQKGDETYTGSFQYKYNTKAKTMTCVAKGSLSFYRATGDFLWPSSVNGRNVVLDCLLWDEYDAVITAMALHPLFTSGRIQKVVLQYDDPEERTESIRFTRNSDGQVSKAVLKIAGGNLGWNQTKTYSFTYDSNGNITRLLLADTNSIGPFYSEELGPVVEYTDKRFVYVSGTLTSAVWQTSRDNVLEGMRVYDDTYAFVYRTDDAGRVTKCVRRDWPWDDLLFNYTVSYQSEGLPKKAHLTAPIGMVELFGETFADEEDPIYNITWKFGYKNGQLRTIKELQDSWEYRSTITHIKL